MGHKHARGQQQQRHHPAESPPQHHAPVQINGWGHKVISHTAAALGVPYKQDIQVTANRRPIGNHPDGQWVVKLKGVPGNKAHSELLLGVEAAITANHAFTNLPVWTKDNGTPSAYTRGRPP